MNTLAAIAVLVLAQDPAAEPVTVRLTAFPKRGAGELRYDGKALFPDGVVLKGTLYRLEERLKDDVLAPEATEIQSDRPAVEGNRIAFVFAVKDPGVYRLVVEYLEDLQEPDVLASIKNRAAGKWSFEHCVWGDELIGSLGSRLHDVELQADAAVALIRRFAGAAGSAQSWKELYPILDKELSGWLKKLDQAGLDRSFPAAALELRCSMRNLKGNAEAILFGEDGKCRGSIDYHNQKPTKTIHSEDFTFEAVLKDVEATKRAAEREYLLWIIRDFGRAGARTALEDAIRSEARRPGVAPFAEALVGFKDVAGVEKRIRGASAAR